MPGAGAGAAPGAGAGGGVSARSRRAGAGGVPGACTGCVPDGGGGGRWPPGKAPAGIGPALDEHRRGRRRRAARPIRERHGNRNRQEAGAARRGRRGKEEIRLPARQQVDRRRGRRRIIVLDVPGIRTHDLDPHQRRGKIVFHLVEEPRRLDGSGQPRQAAVGVACMRPVGIAAQIGPVGLGRVPRQRALPEQRLAPDGEDALHARRIDGVGIEAQILLVGRESCRARPRWRRPPPARDRRRSARAAAVRRRPAARARRPRARRTRKAA